MPDFGRSARRSRSWGEFDNVLFQVGNEGFKRFSEAWEVGVYQIVKDELRVRGISDRRVDALAKLLLMKVTK